MSSLARSKPFAVMVGTGVVATAGYMYIAGNQSKHAAQSASIYKSAQEGAGLNTGTTDARVGSEGVRAAVHGDKAALEKARH
ncbi:hypothetical protein BDY19DRAFT_992667 [Irpex rosettiformis]|uniref:Uncharacterized protein n=1 Tax=Irpex rosettiformis TaxID=378272 RepID=A0ACB8U8B2_9APHY|nr:hypothetical protein BDY19DRAFT_992667 [Irpex rosettiformis]